MTDPAADARPAPSTTPIRRRPGVVVAGVAAGVIAIAAFILVWSVRRDTTAVLLREVVNDHLRVVHGAHPVDIEATDMRDLKAWFAGRVDFAAGLAFQGDADYPLRGAALGWFLDRKCAVYVFARAQHAITLLVLPASGLDWPKRNRARERGFETLLWRDGDLAYALASDADPADLAALAARLAPK